MSGMPAKKIDGNGSSGKEKSTGTVKKGKVLKFVSKENQKKEAKKADTLSDMDRTELVLEFRMC